MNWVVTSEGRCSRLTWGTGFPSSFVNEERVTEVSTESRKGTVRTSEITFPYRPDSYENSLSLHLSEYLVLNSTLESNV